MLQNRTCSHCGSRTTFVNPSDVISDEKKIEGRQGGDGWLSSPGWSNPGKSNLIVPWDTGETTAGAYDASSELKQGLSGRVHDDRDPYVKKDMPCMNFEGVNLSCEQHGVAAVESLNYRSLQQ